VYGWQGLLAPAGTPEAVIERLSAAVEKVLSEPSMKAKFASQGAEVAYQDPAAFGGYIQAEQQRWGKVIQTTGIKVTDAASRPRVHCAESRPGLRQGRQPPFSMGQPRHAFPSEPASRRSSPPHSGAV